MKVKAFVVIDTNVLISAMLSTNGAPHEIFKLIESGNLIPIFDKRILKEYYRVFKYDKFNEKKQFISDKAAKNTLCIVIKNGIYINDVDKIKNELEELMPDKDDIPFFEVKESSHEFDSMLVTGNLEHYPLDDRYIVSSKELLIVLKQMDRFVQMDLEYIDNLKTIIADNLSSSKYMSGDELLATVSENEDKELENLLKE
jgi:putative PIN family toxin of toxin-antitoxin system